MVRAAMSAEGRRPDESDQNGFANAAWSVPSYLLSGMLVYGGIGWLVGRWLHVPVLFFIGVVLGLAIGTYLVYVRHVR